VSTRITNRGACAEVPPRRAPSPPSAANRSAASRDECAQGLPITAVRVIPCRGRAASSSRSTFRLRVVRLVCIQTSLRSASSPARINEKSRPEARRRRVPDLVASDPGRRHRDRDSVVPSPSGGPRRQHDHEMMTGENLNYRLCAQGRRRSPAEVTQKQMTIDQTKEPSSSPPTRS
jgi:hypothetical protein